MLNAVERQEHIVKILMLRGQVTAKELAEEFGVSERTIFRDISALSNSKPISAMPGKGGGVFITDTYAINQLHMKTNETDLLQKIISDTEKYSYCALTDDEIQLLKDIVTLYSSPQYLKGKRI